MIRKNLIFKRIVVRRVGCRSNPTKYNGLVEQNSLLSWEEDNLEGINISFKAIE
jgi:hypothetical protein